MRQASRTRVSVLLREQTREAHENTDNALSAVAPVGTQAGYERFLLVMLDAYHEFGDALDLASRATGLPTRSPKLKEHLLSDLTIVSRAIGRPIAPLGATAPLEQSPSGAPNLTTAFGCAYALEGASLGASILRRRVHQDLQDATTYFDAVINDRKTRWPAFVDALDQLSSDSDTASMLRTGALMVFDRVCSAAQEDLMRS